MFSSSGFAFWAILATSVMAPDRPKDREIQILVDQLGSPRFREREKANRELIALGDTARSVLLRSAASTTDPEIERRLEVLIAKIDHDRLVVPKRITLHGRYPVQEIVRHITRQTGYTFSEITNDEKIMMSVNWSKIPFWDAIDEIANATGFSIQMNGDESATIGLFDGDSYDPYVYRNGPYRLVATSIGTNSNRQLSGLPRRAMPNGQYGGINLNLMLYSEPKNPMLSVGVPTVTKAIDDQGQSLVATNEDSNRFGFSSFYYSGGGMPGHSLYSAVNLAKPGKDATMIKELRGKVPVTLLAGSRPELTIEPLAKSLKKKFVSRTTEVVIESLSHPEDEAISVTINAKLLRPNPDDYTWASIFAQRLELYDESGQKFSNAGVTAQQQNPGATSLTINFAIPQGKKLGKPTRLVIVEWISKQRDVDFVFEGIPLP